MRGKGGCSWLFRGQQHTSLLFLLLGSYHRTVKPSEFVLVSQGSLNSLVFGVPRSTEVLAIVTDTSSIS